MVLSNFSVTFVTIVPELLVDNPVPVTLIRKLACAGSGAGQRGPLPKGSGNSDERDTTPHRAAFHSAAPVSRAATDPPTHGQRGNCDTRARIVRDEFPTVTRSQPVPLSGCFLFAELPSLRMPRAFRALQEQELNNRDIRQLQPRRQAMSIDSSRDAVRRNCLHGLLLVLALFAIPPMTCAEEPTAGDRLVRFVCQARDAATERFLDRVLILEQVSAKSLNTEPAQSNAIDGTVLIDWNHEISATDDAAFRMRIYEGVSLISNLAGLSGMKRNRQAWSGVPTRKIPPRARRSLTSGK